MFFYPLLLVVDKRVDTEQFQLVSVEKQEKDAIEKDTQGITGIPESQVEPKAVLPSPANTTEVKKVVDTQDIKNC